MDENDLTIQVRGEAVTLMPERTAFWHAGVLMAADLHWGKAQSLQASGVASPCTLDRDLARLSRAIQRTRSHTAVLLGDLIHSADSMTPDLHQRICAWRRTIDCDLVLTSGNHDRHLASIPIGWQIRALPELRSVPFVFRHMPEPLPDVFVWSGHLHPVCVLKDRRDRLRLPCFAVGETVGILPSFGSLTGGFPVNGPYRTYAVAEDRIVATGEPQG